MSRAPGKKVRMEAFKLKSGKHVEVELRLLEKGEFYINLEGTGYRNATLEDLRAEVFPVLEAMHTVEYRPVILVQYEKPSERGRHWRNGHEIDPVEVKVSFQAGYVSTASIDGHRHRWIQVHPDDETGAIPPMIADEFRNDYVYPDDAEEALPFTPERWLALTRIKDALKELQARIADVMGDATGKKLDAIPGGLLLLASPKEKGR